MVDRAVLSLEKLISITSLPQNVSQGKTLSFVCIMSAVLLKL